MGIHFGFAYITFRLKVLNIHTEKIRISNIDQLGRKVISVEWKVRLCERKPPGGFLGY